MAPSPYQLAPAPAQLVATPKRAKKSPYQAIATVMSWLVIYGCGLSMWFGLLSKDCLQD